MNLSRSLLTVYALYLLVGVPAALYCHAHLYWDGAYYFAEMIRTGQTSAGLSLARVFHSGITQLPTLLARGAGLEDPRLLSWIYGASLYVPPLLAYAGATWLLLRQGLAAAAVLVTGAFALTATFAWFFIISESHLGAGMYVLTLAVLLTANLARGRSWLLVALLCLLGFSLYEFWVFYFGLLVAVLFLLRSRWPAIPGRILTLGLLCGAGAAWNAYAILNTKLAGNRDGMLQHLLSTRGETAAILVGFVLLGLLCWRASRPSAGEAPAAAAPGAGAFLGPLLGLGLLALFTLAVFFRAATPWHAYNHRLLNLFLPVGLTLGLLWALRRGGPDPLRLPELTRLPGLPWAILHVGALPALVLIFHAAGFREYTLRLAALCAENRGYFAIDVSSRDLQRYSGVWNVPATSLVFQAVQRAPFTAVAYVRGQTFQPYALDQAATARELAARLRPGASPEGLTAAPPETLPVPR
jgi:hypothetical protein